MKALVAALVALVVVAAGFGVYRMTSGDEERDRARAAADEFAVYVSRAADGQCEASELHQLPNDLWRFRFDCGSGSRCMALDLERFRATRNDSVYVGGNVEGVEDIRCTPDSWTPREAAQRLVESEWARRRKARFFSCGGPGELRYAPYNNRFGCRYSSPRGDGYVLIRTTGADTFEVESTQ
jgi:hypothetical protein